MCVSVVEKNASKKQSTVTMIQISYNSSWDTAAPKENTNNFSKVTIKSRLLIGPN